MTTDRCALCGRPINPYDDDAVRVQAGFVHQSCLEQYDGEWAAPNILEREQAWECSTAELERQKRNARRRKG
jgi:hypothetical protein